MFIFSCIFFYCQVQTKPKLPAPAGLSSINLTVGHPAISHHLENKSTIHEDNFNTFISFSTTKKVKKSKVKKNLPTCYGGALNAPITVTASVLQLCI